MTGCFNPFQSVEAPSPRVGSISINAGGELAARTIMPDLANLDSLAVRRLVEFTNTAPGGLTRDPVDFWATGTPINDIPYGTWTIDLSLFDGGDNLIATGSATNVVIDAASVPVAIDINPLTGGSGTLQFDVSFPAAAVDTAVVELEPYPVGTAITLNAPGDYNADFGTTGTLSIDATVASGAYALVVQLSDSTASGDGAHAPIVKAVQIFDNLVSTTPALTLSLAELRSPPDAPTDMIVEFTAENTFNVYWTDNSNTEEGFRIYQDDGLGNRLALGTDLASGTTSVQNQNSAFTPPMDYLTLEVVAFNQFGESDPLSFTFRLLQAAQFPNFQNSANTNSPFWAAAANPGSVNWSTMIVGGGSAVNLYLDSNPLNDLSNLPGPIGLGGPPYNLSLSGPFTQLATYNWRVETVGNIGNEGRVIYPVNEFTVRDDTIHVADTGNAGAAGSLLDPLGAIQDAIDLAMPAETVSVEAGTYNEAITVNKAGLLLQGAGDTSVISPPAGSGTTVIISAADVTVRNFQVRIGNLNTRSGITISGVNATVENNLVTEDPAAPDGVTIRGISGGVGQGARIAGNRIVLANVPGVTVNTRWGVNMTGSGENAANPLVINGNRISYGDAPGTSNIAIQPQGDNQLITNNVMAQEGANAGQDFTGVRITVTPLNPRVIHNTIVNTNPQRTTYGLRVESGDDIVIANNIVAGLAAQFNTGIQQSGGTITEANSNLFSNVNSVAGALGATAALFNTQQTFATGNVEGNPLLDDAAAIEADNWFAPASVSPVTEGDTSYLALVSDDILGTARTRPTIGAYE